MIRRFAIFLAAFVVSMGAFGEGTSVLFGANRGIVGGHADLHYLQELHEAGYQVDYTTGYDQLTWDRIRQYNVLVLYEVPVDRLADIERFVQAGGGVLLMTGEQWIYSHPIMPELMVKLGAKLAVETIEEANPDLLGSLTQASYDVPLAYTQAIEKTPISAGVDGLWYPPGMTHPIVVDDSWQVVARTSTTAKSVPHSYLENQPQAVTDKLFFRAEGQVQPAFVALREYGKGRVVLVNQWPQFTVGSGTRFIFNHEVLEKGVMGRPSGMGKLLTNAYDWLAAPSLADHAVGGYTTDPDVLVPPNLLPHARQEFEYTFWYWEYEIMQWHRPPKFAPVFKGLIGARTALSTGAGTVADYAAAAREAGLDFVVFTDDFAELTRAEYDQLRGDCAKHSDEYLALIPGFSIAANTGNKLLFYGLVDQWPPAEGLGGPAGKTLMLQPETEDGMFTGFNGPAFGFCLDQAHGPRSVAYYDFKSDPHGMQVPDLRLYSAVACRYYKDGKLVEDVTSDVLLANQGTLGPQPIAVNEVRSPAALKSEVNEGHSLTYAQARGLDSLMGDALRWQSQYDALNTFCSSGPIIRAWPMTYRHMTAGAEEFVVTPNVMAAELHVTAPKGLKELRIYDGGRLFRRINCEGATSYRETLLLNASLHRNLAVVAEDRGRGIAVSQTRRCWKSGTRTSVYCGDHVNDCKSGGMLLGRGPNPMLVTWPPELPMEVAGYTWDGGPPGQLPLVFFQESRPRFEADGAVEDVAKFRQIPLLEFGDEGAVGCTSLQDQMYSDRFQRIVNPWHTFGPLGPRPEHLVANLRYREWMGPTVGVPEAGWAGPGVRDGFNAVLFRTDLRFLKNETITQLRLLLNRKPGRAVPSMFAWGPAIGQTAETFDLTALTVGKELKLAPGAWFAFYSPRLSNTQIFVNRLEPIIMKIGRQNFIDVYADIAGRQVTAGDLYAWELLSVNAPLSVDLRDLDAVTSRLAYLAEPTGLVVHRGRRVSSPGLLDVDMVNGAVEVEIPKPATRTDLTVPLRLGLCNPRWSVGLWQQQGYCKGDYGSGENRYRPLGQDIHRKAYVPLYVDRAATTRVVAGHPVVATGDRADELFIQVTLLMDNPWQWHVAVNNPTDKPISAAFANAMGLPNLVLPREKLVVGPGERRVLR